MENSPVRIVQLSDTHLFANINDDLLGVKTYESFRLVLDLLKKETPQPENIVVSGDLSQDYSEQSYIHFKNLMKDFTMPIHYVCGNHDHYQNMEDQLKEGNFSNKKNVIVKNWQIILLNSQVVNSVFGQLDEKQLTFMTGCLDQHATKHAIIIVHHHPLSVGSDWIEDLGVTNASLLWDTLKQYPQVKAILFGHVHQEFFKEKAGIQCYGSPSTCIQFKRNSSQFALEKLPPGYRWIDLYDNGQLVTGIKRIEHYSGRFMSNAEGY